MEKIKTEEMEITEWDIRRIPELMQIPVGDFVIGYHETKKSYDESLTDEDRDFHARELQWLELLIDIRYKDSNIDYKCKPFNFKALKNGILHPLMMVAIKTTKKYKIHMVNESKIPKDKAVLFVANHISSNDIPIIMEVVKKPVTTLASNDTPHMTKQQKKLMETIGCYLFDRRSPEERNAAKEYLTTELAKGRSGVIFPESIWNRTESLPILPMHWGFVDIAKNAKVDIMPIGIDLRDGEYYINMGELMTINPHDNPFEVYGTVRDALATKRWEIWESFPTSSREQVLQAGLELDNSLYWDIAHETQFMFKPYETPEEVFAPVTKLLKK